MFQPFFRNVFIARELGSSWRRRWVAVMVTISLGLNGLRPLFDLHHFHVSRILSAGFASNEKGATRMPRDPAPQSIRNLTTERSILRAHVEGRIELNTDVRTVGEPRIPNPVAEGKLGRYRPPEARKSLTADMDVISLCIRETKEIPSLQEAGPRSLLFHDPHQVRAAIVTTGGVAPGLNSIVHSIVKRHHRTYSIFHGSKSGVFGVYDSFLGLSRTPIHMKPLDPDVTERWIDSGGSVLGNMRGQKSEGGIEKLAQEIVANLEKHYIDILYVIGGDGSQRVAHQVAGGAPTKSIVGLPKTMDHYCPVRSRIESAGWCDRVSFHGSLMAARPVKWAFSQIG